MKRIFVSVFVIGLSIFFMTVPFSLGQAYLEEIRACHFLEQGKIEDAMTLLNRKLKRYPQNYDCHLYLGLAYYLKGDFEKAMDTLNKVEFEIEKLEKAKTTMEAGKKLESFGQEDAYIAQRGGVVFTKGRKGILKFALGMLYKRNKDFKNVRKKFSDALKYRYPEFEARKQLLASLSFIKNYNKAQEQLKSLIEAGQKSDALIFMEGYLAYYLKDESRAVECFSKLSDNLPVAQRNLAVVYYNKGNYQKALEIWQDILADSPKDVDSLKNSGRAYFHLGEKEKGQEQFDKIGLKMKVEKYSPKRIPLFLVDLFPDVKFDFQCKAKN